MNGGQNYNANTTATQFIPQDNRAMNNLNYNYNYNYSSNYGGSNQVHHDDYHSYYGRFEELPEDNDGLHIDPEKNSSFSTTMAGINIANHLMGAGLLSAPIIMSYLGLLVGIIFYIFMAIMTLYSVYILMRCHEITGKSGYSMLAKITLGKVGNIIVKIVLIIQGFGLCAAYLRIFGECLQTVFQAWISKGSYLVEDSQVYLFILFGGLIMIIFVSIKKISNLKRFTYLGMILGLVICLSISILLFYKGIGNYLDSDISWDFLFPDCSFSEAFQSSTTIYVAFLFHANAFPIYYSINNRNRQSMMKATKIGVILSIIIFLIFGIIGLFLYGFDIDDTILENFYEDMGDYRDNNIFIVILLIILCLFFILLSLTSFPILFKTMIVNFVNSLIICTKGCRRSGSEQEVQISQNNSQKKSNFISKKILYFINFLSYILIIAFAILIYRIQALLTIVGATTGIFLIFILPNLFYIIIMRQTGKKYNTCLPIALVAFGVFFFVNALVTAFI
jgi:amino acid permease